jgi:hypothetical protein
VVQVLEESADKRGKTVSNKATPASLPKDERKERDDGNNKRLEYRSRWPNLEIERAFKSSLVRDRSSLPVMRFSSNSLL